MFNFTCVFKVSQITFVAARLGQFCETLKTRVKLNTNFTRPHAITYTNTQFAKCKSNLKATWKLIGSIIKRKMKQKDKFVPQKVIINNKIYTTKHDIANQLNQYFVNVGPNLANSIMPSNFQPISYISKCSSI